MVRDRQLQIRRTDTDTVKAGFTHERLDQYWKGVRIFGGDIARATHEGVTTAIFGRVYTDVDLETTPGLSAEDIVRRIEGEGGQLHPALSPELVVLPRDEGGFVLTWKVDVFKGGLPEVQLRNATTGAVELAYSAVHRQTAAVGSGRGVLGDQKKVSTSRIGSAYYASDMLRPPQLLTFDASGDWRWVDRFLNGLVEAVWSDVASDVDNAWTDGAASCLLLMLLTTSWRMHSGAQPVVPGRPGSWYSVRDCRWM
jgi:Zn-dependent metalloprotease